MQVRVFRSLLMLVLILSSLILSGCEAVVQKGFKPASDWSRGMPVGRPANGSLGLAVEGTGWRIHLVWPYQTERGGRIRYLQMDRAATPVVDRDLELPSGQLRAPRLLLADSGRLHLFWVNRPTSGAGRELWYALLDSDGRLAGEVKRVSAVGVDVGSYDVAADTSGGAAVAWDDSGLRGRGGVFCLRLSSAGTVAFGPVTVVRTGDSPALRVDAAGTVHLAWLEGTDFLYASFSEQGESRVAGVPIADVDLGTGDNMVGPALGLSEGWVYVFWSVRGRAHEKSGSAYTEFVAFPAGAPSSLGPKRLSISSRERQHYQNYELARGVYSIHVSGEKSQAPAYQLSQLVRSAPAWDNSEFVYQPHPVQGQRAGLAIAVSSNQQLRQERVIQIAIALFEAGQFKGYQMAAKTESLSRQPALAVDDAGNLHLAWREGAAGDLVFYATTAPDTRSVLDQMSVGDIVQVLLRGGVESAATIMLFPAALPWLVPGLTLLIIWMALKSRAGWLDVSPWLPAIGAVGLYQGAKLFFMPTIVSHVPFSAWVYIPVSWGLPLRVGVPLLILSLAVLVAERVRRRYPQSALLLYMAFALTDMVLTLAVYGVSFLGEF
jgi:hypothetical protein